jgi:1-aminocyclopropane-1-carboxylate deaminase/D-cysteine desulfhydrase-like pyridoxal-dependent ACC family enzyme
MQLPEIEQMINAHPRAKIGFYPTPFHKLDNLSEKYGVNLYLKREDLAGPGSLSGSKIRVAEFVIGQALADGVDTIITQGAYLTNSGMQFAMACRKVGITPVLFLTRDEARHGELVDYRGNLLLDKLMDVETYYLKAPGSAYVNNVSDKIRVMQAMSEHKARLESRGHKVLIVPTGGALPCGFMGHVLTMKEIIEQSAALGITPDYLYHTTGTGTALPGMLAAKLLTDHPIVFRSISISHYSPDYWINEDIIADRVAAILEAFGGNIFSRDQILRHICVDNRFIGENYAAPTAESLHAIKELARFEGVFLGPVYSGKGFAGLLEHIRSGKIEKGSHVVFLHTGDTANLFEGHGVTGINEGTFD